MRSLLAPALALLVLPLPGPVAGAPRMEGGPRTEMSHPCSRVVSRHVRKSMEKEIFRVAQKQGADRWPRGCPLDPARDLWARHEKQKTRKRGSGTLWTCGLCGKVFKSEHYLDLHMERKHMNETPRGGVCLADYCELFEVCGGDARYRRRREKEEGTDCNNATMVEARHRCEEAMTKCFPLENEVSRKLNAKFSKQYCRVLDCRIRAEQKKEHHSDLMPVIVLLILITLVGFIVFSLVVCCVDYSDDIFKFLVESGLASSDWVRGVTQRREQVRQVAGFDRTKCI